MWDYNLYHSHPIFIPVLSCQTDLDALGSWIQLSFSHASLGLGLIFGEIETASLRFMRWRCNVGSDYSGIEPGMSCPGPAMDLCN